MYRKIETSQYRCIMGEKSYYFGHDYYYVQERQYSYVIQEMLGTGAYGSVWKAMDTKTGKFYAMKILNERVYKEEDIWKLAEVKCLKSMRHPNIIRLHRVILHETTLCLVFDLMDCDLLKLMNRRGRGLLEYEVRNICFQILKGLAHLHKQGYCHRDLKPENLLAINGYMFKISDLGMVKKTLHESDKSLEWYVGTRSYRAPELLLGSTHYDSAIDMWAIGVIMTELLTGRELFRMCCMAHQWHKICSVIGTPDSKTWPDGVKLANDSNYALPKYFMEVDSTKQLSGLLPSASGEAIDLINSLLSWDPKKRPTAKAALQHPFFHSCYNISELAEVCFRSKSFSKSCKYTLLFFRS